EIPHSLRNDTVTPSRLQPRGQHPPLFEVNQRGITCDRNTCHHLGSRSPQLTGGPNPAGLTTAGPMNCELNVVGLPQTPIVSTTVLVAVSITTTALDASVKKARAPSDLTAMAPASLFTLIVAIMEFVVVSITST